MTKLIWDFERWTEVKRSGKREVCWFCEAGTPEDCLVVRASGRFIHACHSCANLLLDCGIVCS
ncbi:MAG: hypothetical protein KGJ23_15355 [Euryarchaeota archaeon]|nr:hypothetical protein [Euryarchaeota archaeon]MDE1837977.1 hypothetical protein [Euryarchaeota archaeon]MDE1882100.1 hypothetical protein [Euryarchaeota archaeon]MDE2046415.1 hypothetical protein [Thermoplasmata archaeon]